MNDADLPSVETLQTVYRARKFLYPKSDREFIFACNMVAKAKFVNPNAPTKYMLDFLRSPDLQNDGLSDKDFRLYIEPCEVVRITGTTIGAQSLDLDPTLLFLFPDFLAGGVFTLAKGKLQRDGVTLHTRHKEHFFIEIPTRNIALSHSPQCLIKIRRSLENARCHEHAIKKAKIKSFKNCETA